ncbi:hypothetical protein [Planococcus shixiaomingii]|uniref:hypothetical protein n=1 Tax=Planococcus shixiaomingii TaxID=3058393 RepID=UPI002633B869|nr:hypothetical protein [Planococcus sp. N022]WKA53217.1 hypothetical protein QWY21_11155 [Planococcus sp. N022]
MRKRAWLIGPAGNTMVTIGIVMLLANSPEKPIAAAMWIIAGIVVALYGILLETRSRIEIAQLVVIFIAVLFYFFTQNKTLTNFFTALAVILVIAQFIMKFKNRAASRPS